jgi:hypothetical protein
MPGISGSKALAFIASAAMLAAAWSVAGVSPASAFGPWCLERMPVDGRFPSLLDDADAVVAAEIIGAGSLASPQGSPVAVEATADLVLKGEIPPGSRLVFAESPWCGPTYRRGERRLLFLSRDPPDPAVDPSWWSLCPVTAKLDCFLDRREEGDLTVVGVEDFLELLSRARSHPPAMEASIISWLPGKGGLAIRVALVNRDADGMWLDPSRLRAVAFAGGAMHAGDFEPAPGAGWVLLPPQGTVEGTARFPGVAPDGRGAVLTIHSDAAVFPRRCWTGAVTSTLLEVSR